MSLSRFWKPLIVSLVATPIFVFLALLSGGAGHGNYLWARMLFPYTILSALISKSITTPFALFAIIQYPLYGVALGLANNRHKLFQMIVAVSLIHLLAVTICFLFPSENFS